MKKSPPNLNDIKESNPKDSIGVMKAGISNVPMLPLMELAVAMMEGSVKYGRHNYRAIGVRASVYVDAIWRHLISFWEGEDIDSASGLPHIVKIMACCAVLRDAQLSGKYYDDRPPRHVSPVKFLADLENLVKDLAKKYPNPKAPYTEQDQKQTTGQAVSNTTPIDIGSVKSLHDEVYKRNAHNAGYFGDECVEAAKK